MIIGKSVQDNNINCYCVGVLSAQLLNTGNVKLSKTLLSDIRKIITTSKYRSSNISCISELSPTKYLFMINGSLNDINNNTKAILTLLPQTLNNQGMNFRISLSKPRIKSVQLVSAVCEALKALNQEGPGDNLLDFNDKTNEEENSVKIPLNRINYYADTFLEAIINSGEIENIKSNIDKLFDEIIDMKLCTKVAWQICNDILVCSASKLCTLFEDNKIITECLQQEFLIERYYISFPILKMKTMFINKILELSRKVKTFISSEIDYIKVVDILLKTRCSDVSLNFVADYLNITPSYLSSQFKKSTGMLFKNYIYNYKMKKSVYFLINSHLKICDIAKKLGYTDVVHFSRIFRKKFGHSPSEYRTIRAKEDCDIKRNECNLC